MPDQPVIMRPCSRLDLSDDPGPVGLDALRDDERPAQDALEALERKVHGLAGSAGDTQDVEKLDLGLGKLLADVVDDIGVVGAAAAEVDLLDAAGGTPAAVAVDEGLGRDACDGRDAVFGGGALGEHAFAELLAQVVAEGFAAGGLGDVVDEVRAGEDLVDDLLVDFALGAHLAVFVVLLLAVGEVADGSGSTSLVRNVPYTHEAMSQHSPIDKNIPWTGIKVISLPNIPLRKHCNIRNPPNILHGTVHRRVRRAESIERHKERTALSPQSHVADAERRDRRHARLGRDDRNLSHVDVCTDLVAFEQLGEREVPDGLALARNEVDFFLQVEAFVLCEFEDRVCGEFSKLDVHSHQPCQILCSYFGSPYLHINNSNLLRRRLVLPNETHNPLYNRQSDIHIPIATNTIDDILFSGPSNGTSPYRSSFIFSGASGCSCVQWMCTMSRPSMDVPTVQ